MYRKVRPQWYTADVAEKKNEDWSLQDRLLVYTLRVKENKPVDEVVEILKNKGKKADKISVYNLTRQSRKALEGKCIKCGNDLTSQEFISRKPGRILYLCTSCKKIVQKSKKERRDQFLEQGLCGSCGKTPHLPGITFCRKCLSAVNRRRLAKGLCGTCGKNPIDTTRSIHQCRHCLELNSVKARMNTDSN